MNIYNLICNKSYEKVKANNKNIPDYTKSLIKILVAHDVILPDPEKIFLSSKDVSTLHEFLSDEQFEDVVAQISDQISEGLLMNYFEVFANTSLKELHNKTLYLENIISSKAIGLVLEKHNITL